MTTKSSEEQKKAAMAAVWDSVIRRSNAKKDIEKALADADMGNGDDKSKISITSTAKVQPADQAKPTISAVPADANKPEPKKKFTLTPKIVRGLVIGAVAAVLIAVFAVIWHNHEVYLATPAGQANAIYNDKESDKSKIKKKYGDKYDEYYGDLRRAANLSVSGGVNAMGIIDSDKKELRKWNNDDIGKAQFCIIYAKKTASSDDEITELALVHYLATVETAEGVKVYGVDELPLSSDKYASDTLNSLVKKLTKDDKGDGETE